MKYENMRGRGELTGDDADQPSVASAATGPGKIKAFEAMVAHADKLAKAATPAKSSTDGPAPARSS